MASLLVMLLPPNCTLLYLMILLIMIQIPPYLSSNDDNYTSCVNTRYDCGKINNIGFPFWGENRPKQCGHPLLQLNCDHDHGFTTYITIKNMRYQVLEAYPENQTMKIARVDYFEGLCPSKAVNTSLDFELFDYGPGNKNLTLFYHCSLNNGFSNSIPGFLNCFSNRTSNEYFYAELEALGDPPSSVVCTTSVFIPLLLQYDVEVNLSWSKIEGAIHNGFLVKWIGSVGECFECMNSGGACGYDWNSNQPTCYCKDQSSYSNLGDGHIRTCDPSATSPTQDDHGRSDAADNGDYLACKNTLSCGTINELTYPFWGEIGNSNNRPNYCGEPNLEIKCDGNNNNNNNGVPKFTVGSVTYRILDWNIGNKNLTVARDDYFDNSSDFCSRDYSNNTLDETILQYDDNSVVNITLLYKCSSETKPSDPFKFIQSCNSGSVYYAEEQETKALPNYGGCTTVIFPVSKALASAFANSGNNPITNAIQTALESGFGLKLLPQSNDQCSGCTNSGGECGSGDDGHFVCFCSNGTQSNYSCSEKSSSNKAAIAAGAASGAVVFVVLLIGTLFVVRRRRRNAERSRSNKDTLPLSGVPLTSSTTSSSNTSQSVSSYPSSKSESVPRSYYYGVQVFDYAELEEATNNFDPSRELGEGGFGTVYKGMLQDGRVVAVKRHYESHLKRVEQYMNEVELLAHLRHKNLVTLFGCTSRHSRELILVYEFIPNGTLADHLHGSLANSTLLTWNVRYKIALETAEALSYLHSKKVIHRDVKSTNILLTETFQVKVGDFGLSRLFPKFVTHVSTAPQGTPGYVDPEYYQNYQLTDKSDVYSLGVVLVELISSLQAVDITRNRNEVNLASLAVNRIQNQELHDMVDPCLGFEKDNDVRRMVTAVAELAFRCLQQQRDMRPSMDEVLEILRGVKGNEFGALERNSSESVVGVNHNKTEEVILLKKVPSPVSPDSVADKWQWDMLRRSA